jgi:hypothetical protein
MTQDEQDPYAGLISALDQAGFEHKDGIDMVGEYIAVPAADGACVWHPDFNTGGLPIWVITRHHGDNDGAHDVFTEEDTKVDNLNSYAEITVPQGDDEIPLLLLLLLRLAGRRVPTLAEIRDTLDVAAAEPSPLYERPYRSPGAYAYAALSAARHADPLSPGERSVLAAVAAHAEHSRPGDDYRGVTFTELAALTGLTEDHARRAARLLICDGLLGGLDIHGGVAARVTLPQTVLALLEPADRDHATG